MRYDIAISLLLAAQLSSAFQSTSLAYSSLRQQHSIQLSVAASLSDGNPSSNVTDGALYLTNLVTDAVQTDDDEEEIELAERRRKYTERSGIYRVKLPLAQPLRTTQTVAEQPVVMGLCLRQISAGSKDISDQVLDLDSLALRREEDESTTPVDLVNKRVETIDPDVMRERLEGQDISGVYVSSVVYQSPAWIAGIRPGDMMTATAATLGEALWPKNTLEGVRSALTSRRMVTGSASFEFKRTDVDDKELDNTFELTLSKPIGLNLRETQDGYVEVVGFTVNAPTLVRRAVLVGDRVIAVDSSLGGQMWPVSTVEGVISACTGRLPGQQVTLRFERPEANLGKEQQMIMEPQTLPPKEEETTQQNQRQKAVNGANDNDMQLLKRCRGVLRRYAAGEEQAQLLHSNPKGSAGATFVNKFAVPAMVADRVMEALAEASATMDSVTLSMTMDAYLSCGKPDDAIRAFEAAVGFNGDGSILLPAGLVEATNGEKRVKPNAASALNVYTISSLLKAHAMKQDLKSVRRVVAAMEGRGGEKVSGLETAFWPGTGGAGAILPDTQCYNIAISAGAKAGTSEGLQLAIKLFDGLSEPSVIFKGQAPTIIPEKNAATYNSVIGALVQAGKYDSAFNVFFNMKRVGIKPDKFTYTSLLKACVHDGDLEELLYDMREQGVKPDVVMYNSMIRTLCDEGKLSEARTLITQMEAKGVTPDSKTYGILMKGLLKASKPGACIALFETACSSEQTSQLTENVYLYTTAVTAASLLGDHDRALDLVSRMSTVGVKPNMKTLTALMGACLSSDRPDIAAEVYKKIDTPDGYAMSQGLKAFCLSGDLPAAAKMLSTQQRGSRALSGKQLMEGYEFVVTTAIKFGDYDMARSAFTEVLAKSYIPSKATLRKIIEALGLVEKGHLVMEYNVQRDARQFEFLLFLIDSLRQRNLALDSFLYAATITCGNQLGGYHGEIAYMLVKSKAAFDEKLGGKVVSLEEEEDADALTVQWEEVLASDEMLRKLLTSPALLPPLDVTVGKRDVKTVFFAEKFMARARPAESDKAISSP